MILKHAKSIGKNIGTGLSRIRYRLEIISTRANLLTICLIGRFQPDGHHQNPTKMKTKTKTKVKVKAKAKLI